MKQQMWLLNSSLLLLLVIVWAISMMLYVVAPATKRVMPPRVTTTTSDVQHASVAPEYYDPVFKYDLFGVVSMTKQPDLVSKNLVTPVPEQPPIEEEEPPVPPKQEFIDPLPINVKGIILASDDAHHVAMIEDETKKETLYHLGDAIKDGTVLKIARNRVVVVRANGQQEVFFLRKEDVPQEMISEKNWSSIIKKVDERTFEIDRENFNKAVPSLGNFIERAGIIGIVYENGKPLGISVGSQEVADVGKVLGLMMGDIIVSINNVFVVEPENCMQIFEQIKAMSKGESVVVHVMRNKKDETFTYKFVTLQKAKQQMFVGDASSQAEVKKPDQTLKMSKMQQKEKQVRDFRKQHTENIQQQEAASKIRQRILENLRSRMQNSRVR